ncbi:MAG TPA: TlpA disulfide reductase family protein, partial [Candidatus Acidoferrales bacterium]
MDKNNLNDWVDDRLARLDDPTFQPNTERAFRGLKNRRGKRFSFGPGWLVGAAAAATACACLLVFPTSRDVVQRLFVTASDSKLVYVGQVYADLKTMKDKQPETNFTLKDAEGQPVSLSDLRGKVVLLNFWATWCEGCKTEIPWLVEFQQKYRDKGLAVVGVSEDAGGWKSVKPYLN